MWITSTLMVEGGLIWKCTLHPTVCSEGHFLAVQTTHQFSLPIPSVSLSRGAESFPHCALSRITVKSNTIYMTQITELWGNSFSHWSTVLAVAMLANVTRKGLAAEDCWLRSMTQMLTPSVKPEVRRAVEGSRETWGKERSADKPWVFSSNACQHLKALVGLSSSPGTRDPPRALVLNAERFRRKLLADAGETSQS